MDESVVVRRVRIEGLVQGVGYREFSRRWALRLTVSGWVRNCRDGAVEALIAGAAANVEAMLAKMGEGPQDAEVRNVRVVSCDPGEARQADFEVRATV